VVGRVAVFAVPGALDKPTGGYAYDRRIISELRELGWTIDVLDLGEGFPRPSRWTRQEAGRRLAAVDKGRPLVIDGLAFAVLPDFAANLRASHRLLALVHHPLALESGLPPNEAKAMHASEETALACARRVIATSATWRPTASRSPHPAPIALPPSASRDTTGRHSLQSVPSCRAKDTTSWWRPSPH
jgi:hypothetical protein